MPCRAASWPEPSPGWSAAASAATTCWPTCSARSTCCAKSTTTYCRRTSVTLRREKADWLVAQQELLRKIDKLTREVEGLRKNFNRKPPKKTDETSPTKKPARAAAAATPDGSRMCDDPHHDADLGHTDPNTFGTKRRKIATRQPRTTTTATATGVRLDITNPADCDRIPADGPDPAGDPA